MLVSAQPPPSYLQRNSLLSVLSDAHQSAILRQARVTELKRRERIYHPGEPASQVYLVESGVVKLSVESPEGREAILGFQNPGDLFGEMAVIDDGPQDHRAEAHEDAVVWGISRDVFLGLMRESPALGHAVVTLLGHRMRMYRTRVRELLHQSALARVANTLVHLADQHGVEDADGVVIALRLSQRDIANLVGLTRETVNFILKDLRERNLIETQGHSIRVKNPAALAAHRPLTTGGRDHGNVSASDTSRLAALL